MNVKETLENLKKMLVNEQFECSLEPELKAPPYGKILVFLGNDPLERERILEITVNHQMLGDAQKLPAASQYCRIQFELKLPYMMKEHAGNEVASLLAFLNRMLELPGFELDEVNSRIYYRYVLLTAQGVEDKMMICGIIGAILMLLEIFSGTIEQVAEGSRSFNDLLEEMLQIAAKIKL